MLIRFSVQNFRSVGSKPLTLDMVSSSKVRSLPGHICASSTSAKVLRNAVIYGGNASGKTTLTRAFAFMKAAVLGGALPQASIAEFCKCGEGHKDEESTFEVQLQIDGKVYDYGFNCVLSRLKVTSEWLYLLGSHPVSVFKRDGASSISLGVSDAGLSDSDKVRLEVYKDDFLHEMGATTGAGLFLSALGRARAFSGGSSLGVFRSICAWFESGIEALEANQRPASTEYYADGSTLERVAEVLASFDTGIRGLRKQEVPMEELEKYIPREVIFAVQDFLKANSPKSDTDTVALTVRNDDMFLGIERQGVEEPRATVLKTRHAGSLLDFEFREESDGTKRLFDYMDILFTRSRDKLFVVDELNRSFHPMLTQQLVRLFNDVHANDDCQLVFTTHEDAVMSQEYFRRDEIWFVERDASGHTNLYPLDDFAEAARADARIGKRYLEGRYGGVPVLDGPRAWSALCGGEQ